MRGVGLAVALSGSMRILSSRRVRTLRSFAGPALASVLALSVLANVAQAGRSYFFCAAMQGVMAHSCCAKAAAATHDHAPVSEVAAPECCEARRVPALAPSVAPLRAAAVFAPLAVLATVSDLVGLHRRPAPALAVDARRTGPPPSRARAQLMVFLI